MDGFDVGLQRHWKYVRCGKTGRLRCAECDTCFPLADIVFLEIIFASLGIFSMVELYYYNCGDIDFVTEVGDMGNVSPLDFLENDTMH